MMTPGEAGELAVDQWEKAWDDFISDIPAGSLTDREMKLSKSAFAGGFGSGIFAVQKVFEGDELLRT